ncbi:MAG: metal-dependent hydrolase [Pseudomonadales bacterium]|nr:metal-dependent hydrolase [Pseudomonadales bacterium]
MSVVNIRTAAGNHGPTRSRVDITPRKPNFGTFQNLNKYWAMGNPAVSFGQSLFSMVIPEGEKFFIRSVNAVRDQVTDPQTLEDIKGFAKQEGIHSKYHIVFNDNLVRHGLNVDRVTRYSKRMFNITEKLFSKKAALAVTVFAEHLTAMGAAMEFRFPELTEDTHPEADAFWRWHAAEEMEHKSVAFDVYKQVGGSYFTRVGVVFLFGAMSTLFFPVIVAQEYRGFVKNKSSETPIPLSHIARKYPGINARLGKFAARYFLQYFKPSFHPWDIDNSHYIEKWKVNNPYLENSN